MNVTDPSYLRFIYPTYVFFFQPQLQK